MKYALFSLDWWIKICRAIWLSRAFFSLLPIKLIHAHTQTRAGVFLNPRHLGTWTFRYWLGHLGTRYWPGHLGTRYWTVRDLDETIFGTDHNCLVLINCQYFCTSRSLISQSCNNFLQLNPWEKFYWLMTCEDVSVLKELCHFIYKYCR